MNITIFKNSLRGQVYSIDDCDYLYLAFEGVDGIEAFALTPEDLIRTIKTQMTVNLLSRKENE